MERLNNSTRTDELPADKALLAPEYDRSGDLPQVAEGTYPEVHYQDNFPEAVPINESITDYGKEKHVPTQDTASPRKPFWKRKRWLLIFGAAILVVAIAVGVSVGVGNRRKSDPPSTRNGSPTPESQSKDEPYAMLNETALASVTIPNGDRRIIFQDNNGTVRQAVYHNEKWSAPTSYIIANDAKFNTPLAALLLPEDDFGSDIIVLHYIAKNNSILTQAFAGGSWFNGIALYGNSTWEASPGSRHLSASYIPSESEAYRQQLVIFENQEGSVSAQSAYNEFPDDQDTSILIWQDVTENLTLTYPHANFAAPFTITTNNLGGEPRLVCLFRDGSDSNPDYRQLITQFNSTNETFVAYKSSLEELADPKYYDANNADLVGISLNSDVVLGNVYNATDIEAGLTGPYGGVVNNSRLETFRTQFAGPETGPQTDFPFGRLTTITPVNSTTLFLYHQMNGTHIAEEAYDYEIGSWTTAYVEVDAS